MFHNCKLFLEIILEVVNICYWEDRATFQNKYRYCCKTEISHLMYYENTDGWWNMKGDPQPLLVIPTPHVERGCLCIESTTSTEELRLSLPPHSTHIWFTGGKWIIHYWRMFLIILSENIQKIKIYCILKNKN